jgi:hypothetical protein
MRFPKVYVNAAINFARGGFITYRDPTKSPAIPIAGLIEQYLANTAIKQLHTLYDEVSKSLLLGEVPETFFIDPIIYAD